jgi:hypothetical protein
MRPNIKTAHFSKAIVAETKIMQEVIGKPIDPSASGGVVANSPPKPTIRPIREKIPGPLGPYPLVKHVVVKDTISRPTLSGIEAELAEVSKAWRKYRSINDRDAVYIYLASVFVAVMRWRRLNCALKKSRAALRLRPNPPQMNAEPFTMVIFCTSDLNIADAKTRSKWSRVLRYAQTVKPGEVRLVDFIKSNGGINECARRFARNR